MSKKATTQKRKPYLWEVGFTLFLFMVVVSYTLIVLEGDAHIPFALGCVIASVVAIRTGISWQELEAGLVDSISSVMSSCLIILIIGMVIGSWVQGGIVPALIYYGLQILSPRYFLATICIICCIVSLATGSAYTTLGTMGVAAVGIGAGLGVPIPMVAGAVVSGAFFGDKMSPLSDTTCLASAINNVNIFDHIKHMLYTVTPSLIISLIIYLFLGMQYGASSTNLKVVEVVSSTLEKNFYITPILLLPALAVILMVIFKIPAMPGIFTVSMLGSICALIFQKSSLAEVVDVLHHGYIGKTGVEIVDNLLTRGGLDSMLETVSLILIAVAFGGIMERAGMLDVIVKWLLQRVNSVGTLVLLPILSCIILNIVAIDDYLAIVLTSRMFAGVFKKWNLHPVNLSRIVEDAGTITAPLIPWNTCALVSTGAMGVATAKYAPYAFLCWLCPVISAIYGYTGFSIKKKDDSKPLGLSEPLYEKTSVTVDA